MKFKVCGMKYTENIAALAELQPDYMGMIFFEGSSRNFEGSPPDTDPSIEKIGVFVNEDLDVVLRKVGLYDLAGVQFHGDEDPSYCKSFKDAFSDSSSKKVIKAFSVGDDIDWSSLEKYLEVCDYLLFDAKGMKRGGNGIQFDWELLKGYPFDKPFLISGGIGPEDILSLKDFFQTPGGKYCHAVDVNSGFEDSPGLKNIDALKQFIYELKMIER